MIGLFDSYYWQDQGQDSLCITTLAFSLLLNVSGSTLRMRKTALGFRLLRGQDTYCRRRKSSAGRVKLRKCPRSVGREEKCPQTQFRES